MRRQTQLAGLLIALVFAVPSFAQRSTAPAASLLTGGTHMSPGSPTILSPSFGQVEPGVRFNSGFRFSGQHGNPPLRGTVPPRRDHHNRNHNFTPIYGGYYPYYGYGYAMPVYVDDRSSLPGAGTFDTGNGYEEEDDRVAPTVFENRRPDGSYYRPQAGENSVLDESRYGEHYTDGREAARAATAQPNNGVVSANGNESNDITTILIFKDGMQREVTNYAIMGQYVYVFVGDRRKIPLSEIDVAATIKANEERGGEFKVPSSANPS